MSSPGVLEVPDMWRTIAENSFDGIMIIDPEQRIVFWNCQAKRITGYSPDDVLGQNCLVGVRCPSCLHKCGLFSLGEICDRTVTMMTRTGREITIVKNAQLIRDPDGRVVGGIEVFRRITGTSVIRGEPDEVIKIREALVANRYSRDRTARALGMSRATLWRKMKRHSL